MSADREEHRPETGALGPPHLHAGFAMQRRADDSAGSAADSLLIALP